VVDQAVLGELFHATVRLISRINAELQEGKKKKRFKGELP